MTQSQKPLTCQVYLLYILALVMQGNPIDGVEHNLIIAHFTLHPATLEAAGLSLV